MAIEIKAPLTERLFALGSTVGSQGQNEFKYKGGNTGSYQGEAPQGAPSDTGGRGKALGNAAGALVGAYMQSQGATQTPTNEQGNGFGLGGNLVSGEAGASNYAGSARQPGIFDMYTSQPNQNGGQTGLFDGFKYRGDY